MKGSATPQQKLLKPEQVAEILGVTKTSVYRYAKQGLLPYHQFGRSVRFSEEDLAKFLKRTRQGVSHEQEEPQETHRETTP